MMGERKRDAEAELSLPPGFRFHPTDDELVVHYLCRKVAKQCLPVPIIAEIDLYKYDPWDLPEKALFGQKEWYFFTPRDRKYPNGSRPNRAAGRGYWKATGADKPISPAGGGGGGRPLGIKKALVFYNGKAPKGVKTDWIMHEYRLANTNRTPNKKGSLRLDDWVLCRLYNKKNAWEKRVQKKEEEENEDSVSDSFRNPESDVEFPEFDDLGRAPARQSNGGEVPVPVLRNIKEDSDWFMGLNLDDLQSSIAMPGIDVSNQNYSFSGLGSPYPRLNQSGMLPF